MVLAVKYGDRRTGGAVRGRFSVAELFLLSPKLVADPKGAALLTPDSRPFGPEKFIKRLPSQIDTLVHF